MEVVKIYNPVNGADITTQFVAREDEKRVLNEKTKEIRVTNAKKVTLARDSYVEVDRKTADWLLRIYGFLEEAGAREVESRDPDPVEEPEEIEEKDELDADIEKVLKEAEEEQSEREPEVDNAEFKCECGKVCANKVGLLAHQRHCKK